MIFISNRKGADLATYHAIEAQRKQTGGKRARVLAWEEHGKTSLSSWLMKYARTPTGCCLDVYKPEVTTIESSWKFDTRLVSQE